MANALVTGGGGFLGRYIVKKLLADGHRVSILGRKAQPDLLRLGVTCHQADISDFDGLRSAVTGQDVIFHVAAKAGFWGSYQSYFQANVVGTENLLRLAQEAGVRDFVYTSTPSVVFTGEPFTGEDESLPYGKNWLCAYAQTKAMAEEKVLLANSDCLRTVALRPHLIWGVGDNHLIPRVLAKAQAGKLRQVGDGQNLVDITHVESAAHAHLLAWKALEEKRCDGRAYFISQGEPVNLWSWINDLLARMDIPRVEKKISLAAAYRIGVLAEAVYKILSLSGEPPMTRFVATELGKSHYYSIGNAQRDFGYQPNVSTEEGLTELVAHYRSKQ